MTITATIAGAIVHAGQFRLLHGRTRRNNPLGFVGVLLVSMLAPIAAMLVQMAIARPRVRGRPCRRGNIGTAAMACLSASAHRQRRRAHRQSEDADANPATAHMFIVNPLHGNLAGCSQAIRRRMSALRGCAPWRLRPGSAARSLRVMTSKRACPRAHAALAILAECCKSAVPWIGRSTAMRNSASGATPDLHAPSPARHCGAWGELDALVRGFVTKLPPPHKAGPTFEILLARRLRIAVPRSVAACRRRCSQPAGAKRCQGGPFQALDQCRAAPDCARRPRRRCAPGCRAAQHAGLALVAMVGIVRRGNNAPDRSRPSRTSSDRHCFEGARRPGGHSGGRTSV